MKFAIAAVVTLALALGVESSILPWGPTVAGHGLSYTAVSSPVLAGWPHGPAAVTVAASPAWGPGLHGAGVWGAPSPALVVSAPAAHWAAPAIIPAHEGTYLAKTRGAVHAAPLAGHAASAASINLAPAPGTI